VSFATEIAKNDSERFFLVQITARKEGGAATSTGINTWTCAVSSFYKVTAVYVNGSSVGSFTQGATTVAFTSAVDLTNPANFVHLDVDMFLTGGKARQTVSVAGLPDASWDPRIQSYPSFSQSMRDIAEGVFSLSSSEIRILSTDGYHQKYLDTDVSMSKAVVRVWMCVNDLANNRLVFQGEVGSTSYRQGVWSLSVVDAFNRLKDSASFGTAAQSRLNYNDSIGPWIPQEFEDKAIPITFGYSSPRVLTPGYRHLDNFGDTNIGVFSVNYHVSQGLTATKIAPKNPINNDIVTFNCGRTLGNVRRINLGTISSAYNQYVSKFVQNSNPASPSLIPVFDLIWYLECSVLDVAIGDYIPQLNGNVCRIGPTGFGSYNLSVLVQDFGPDSSNFGTVPASGPVSVPSIPNNTIPSMSVWIEGGDTVADNIDPPGFALTFVRRSHATRYLPFSTSITNYTHFGKVIYNVNISINPATAKLFGDGNSSNSNPLITNRIKFCYRLQDSITHAEALKYFVTCSGMTPNTASYTQAEADLTASDLCMTVPFDDNAKSFPSFLNISQAVTSSTLGALGLNASQEVTYNILKSELLPDKVRDNSDMLQGESGMSAQYQDIATEVIFENPQMNMPDLASEGLSFNRSYNDASKQFLHRSKVTKTIKHYLKNITNCAVRLAGYLKQPTIEYNIATSSKDLAASIGENVEITNQIAANSSGTVKGLVVGLDSSSSKTTIKINEIRGL
jgi:hypothetical protein